MSTEESPRAVVAALLANLGIALTKVLAFVLTSSASMLAESIHSFADSGNQVLLLLGNKRSKRAPTSQHPFGFSRERYIYAFIVSIVLFSVGGIFALYEAYHKFQEVREGHPNELLTSRWWWVPIVVLVAAIGMESLSLRTAVQESNKWRGDVGWVSFVRRAKSPELPVVLLEDVAALLGLVLALFGVGLTLLTDSGYWDVAGTAAIGLLLVAVAVALGIEMKSLLLGESAHLEDQQSIAAAIVGVEDGLQIINLQTLQLGPGSILVACKIAVLPTDTAAELADAINAAEVRIREAVPDATYVFIEPDIRRSES
ncbi:MAG: cation diffusion facilitator family transporter [Nocardioidaceae bacterium]